MKDEYASRLVNAVEAIQKQMEQNAINQKASEIANKEMMEKSKKEAETQMGGVQEIIKTLTGGIKK